MIDFVKNAKLSLPLIISLKLPLLVMTLLYIREK